MTPAGCGASSRPPALAPFLDDGTTSSSTRSSRDDPPSPDAPSSDRATLILDAIPAPSLHVDKLAVSGAGWDGDNTVTITFPLLSNIKGRERTTVDGTGRFAVSMGVTVNKGETYEVTATGEQTGTTVTETFDAF